MYITLFSTTLYKYIFIQNSKPDQVNIYNNCEIMINRLKNQWIKDKYNTRLT